MQKLDGSRAKWAHLIYMYIADPLRSNDLTVTQQRQERLPFATIRDIPPIHVKTEVITVPQLDALAPQ